MPVARILQRTWRRMRSQGIRLVLVLNFGAALMPLLTVPLIPLEQLRRFWIDFASSRRTACEISGSQFAIAVAVGKLRSRKCEPCAVAQSRETQRAENHHVGHKHHFRHMPARRCECLMYCHKN